VVAEQAEFEGPGSGDAGEKPSKSMDGMAFEEAMAELESIVQKLERGQISLEDSIAAYERGTLLRQHCEKKLKEAEARIEKLSIGADGSARAEAFDA
jgi:exodeoxyribonuclease VII small subunit